MREPPSLTGCNWEPFQLDLEPRTKPGEWLEYSPLLTILVVALLCVYLIDLFRTSPQGALAALDLNTFNLIFLTAGLLLQWRPKRFLRAVMDVIPGTAGVIIQFPLYAVIFGMIVGTGLSDKAARLLTSISTHNTFALLVALYSATLGVFIPSGGSKWVIEAPYVLQAAIEHRVNLGWVVQIYNASEALPNLINPFFMLPLLGILRLRARDLVGYGLLQLMVQAPTRVFPVLALRPATAVRPADEMKRPMASGSPINNVIDRYGEAAQAGICLEMIQDEASRMCIRLRATPAALIFLGNFILGFLEEEDECHFSLEPFGAGSAIFPANPKFKSWTLSAPAAMSIWAVRLFPEGRGIGWLCLARYFEDVPVDERKYDPSFIAIEGDTNALLWLKEIFLRAAC